MAEVMRDSISGFVGAVVCTYSGFPFDYVKARLQNGQNKSIVNCVTQTFTKAGPIGFFKGITPALVSAIVENTVLFTANGVFGRALEEKVSKDFWEDNTNFLRAVAGGCAGAFSAISICPAELIKIRMQTTPPQLRLSPLKTAYEIWRQRGIRGFFVGVNPLLFRDIPYYFVFFGSYEFVLEKTSSHSEDQTPWDHAFAGAVGGSIAWSIIFPFDVIKTRHQSDGRLRNSIFRSFRHIYSEGGIAAFYKGWLPAVIRGFPANGGLLLGVSMSLMAFDRLFATSI